MKKSFLYRAVPQKNGVVPWTVATIVVMYTFLCIGCDNVPPLNPCSNYQLPQSREVEVDYKTKAKLASDFALEIEGIKKQLSGKVNRDLLLEIEQATRRRENTVLCSDPFFTAKCNAYLTTICQLHDFSKQGKSAELKKGLSDAIDGHLKFLKEYSSIETQKKLVLLQSIEFELEKISDVLGKLNENISKNVDDRNRIELSSLYRRLEILRNHLNMANGMNGPQQEEELKEGAVAVCPA